MYFLVKHNPFIVYLTKVKMDNYSQLVERIAQASKLEKEEIERKVEAKRAKLSGLVSKEGAAQIVAAELGINFEKEKMKISELVHGMKRANTLCKVINVSPVRSYNKNGREGKVVNLIAADETSNVKVVLWDTNHIALVEAGNIKEGTVIDISNGMVRNGELHLSSFSDIKISKEQIKDVITKKVFAEKKIKNVQAGERVIIRAFIVQVYEPRYFFVSKETGKKVEHENVNDFSPDSIDKRALLSVVLDDGSESIRAVIFGEKIKGLGLTDEEIFSIDAFNVKKNSLLGEEKFFSGNFRNNQLYNTTELMVEEIENVDVEALVKEMEVRN